MTRVYTVADLETLSLRCDALPSLLECWEGPVLLDGEPATLLGPDDEYRGRWLLSRPGGWDVMNDTTWCRSAESRELALPLARSECRHRVARWLAEGKRCPLCTPGDCPSCNDTGYIRPAVDARWMLDWPGLSGSRPPWQSAALLHADALRVAAGALPIRKLLDPWKNNPGDALWTWVRRVSGSRVACDFGSTVGDSGWQSGSCRGPETGLAGMVLADKASLSMGHACLDEEGTLRVEVPGDDSAMETRA